jgi:hypothetical protein
MKYFTPERYLRLGNLDDETAFRSAHRDWENALGRYQKHLARIRNEIPGGLRRLIESIYLHDATVVDMLQGPASRFTITLQPEAQPNRRVVLKYSLLEPPSIKSAVLPADVCSEPTAWLYDEIDVVKPRSNGKRLRRKSPLPTFRHDILLSNGSEIRLSFRNVSVTRPVPLVLAVPSQSTRNAAAALLA